MLTTGQGPYEYPLVVIWIANLMQEVLMHLSKHLKDRRPCQRYALFKCSCYENVVNSMTMWHSCGQIKGQVWDFISR